MNFLRAGFIATPVLLALISGAGIGSAAEAQEASPAAEGPVQCHKKFGVKGRPHRISAVASLAAVRAWVQHAMKYGKEYSIWSEAETAVIKCEKLSRSELFICFASAKPCRDKVQSASNAPGARQTP